MGFRQLLKGCASTFVFAVALTACGGGGGSPGVPMAGAGTSTSTGATSTGGTTDSCTYTASGAPVGNCPPVATPSIMASLVDASDLPIISNSIGSGSAYVKTVLKTASGVAVANKLVTFATDPTVATLLQATVLTDASGVARSKITPASLTASSAGTVTASATIDGTLVTSTADYQTSAANVVLSQLSVGATSITALQTSPVSVRAAVNGVAAASGQVSVNFVASCGSFSPAAAPTASDGTVSTVYKSSATCNGVVTLTAQASGSAPVSTSVNVVAAQATNLLFDSADQITIFTSRAASGIKQATLKFKVVDAGGNAMASQAVLLSLATTATQAGVTFADGTSNTQTVSTDANGVAAVTIISGALPTPVVVTAALASDISKKAASGTLAITSGVPTQKAASLSAESLSIEAFSKDGVEDAITFRIADRQGNPVPQGTAVTFVASHGLIGGSCNLDDRSACTVTYTSQGQRPANGRAIVLAYLDGEESFTDLNGNNSYDPGEPFEALGTVFRDDNENGSWESTEQQYPGGTIGTALCPAAVLQTPSIAGTCTNAWSDSVRVRRQMTIALATSQAKVTQISRTTGALVVAVSDTNGNGMATGSTVAAQVTTTGSACSIVVVSPTKVVNSSGPSAHTITLNGDASCSSASIAITVTSPNSTTTTVSF